jgi:hypothetical protein
MVALGPESTYGDWLEVYLFGFPQRGRFHISADQAMQQKVETLLEDAMHAGQERQRELIQQVAHFPDEVMHVLNCVT